MSRIGIWLILEVLICSLRCQPIVMGEDATPDSVGKHEEHIGSPLAVSESIVKENIEPTPRSRPSHPYYEFHLLEEPPPIGVPGLFARWFAPSVEDYSSETVNDAGL